MVKFSLEGMTKTCGPGGPLFFFSFFPTGNGTFHCNSSEALATCYVQEWCICAPSKRYRIASNSLVLWKIQNQCPCIFADVFFPTQPFSNSFLTKKFGSPEELKLEVRRMAMRIVWRISWQSILSWEILAIRMWPRRLRLPIPKLENVCLVESFVWVISLISTCDDWVLGQNLLTRSFKTVSSSTWSTSLTLVATWPRSRSGHMTRVSAWVKVGGGCFSSSA